MQSNSAQCLCVHDERQSEVLSGHVHQLIAVRNLANEDPSTEIQRRSLATIN